MQFPFLNPKNLTALAVTAQIVIGGEDVAKKEFDVFRYVDPLIGTAEGGKCRVMAWTANCCRN